MNSKITELLSKNVKKNYAEQDIRVGNVVKVTVKIKEGTKERSQNYEGTLIKIKGSRLNKTITVRRVFQGIGVERVFFLSSPKIEKIVTIRKGKARRAKLYYLRERTGKATKLKEHRETNQEVNVLPKEIIPAEGKLVEVTQ